MDPTTDASRTEAARRIAAKSVIPFGSETAEAGATDSTSKEPKRGTCCALPPRIFVSHGSKTKSDTWRSSLATRATNGKNSSRGAIFRNLNCAQSASGVEMRRRPSAPVNCTIQRRGNLYNYTVVIRAAYTKHCIGSRILRNNAIRQLNSARWNDASTTSGPPKISH